MHLCFKLRVTITLLLSLAVLNVSFMRAHPAGFYYSSSAWKREYTKVERICLNLIRLRIMAEPIGPVPAPTEPIRCDATRNTLPLCTTQCSNATAIYSSGCAQLAEALVIGRNQTCKVCSTTTHYSRICRLGLQPTRW